EQILALDLQAAPGEQFIYSNAGAHLVSAILTEAAGEPVLDYARRALFGPLGVSTEPAYTGYEPGTGSAAFEAAGFAWATDPDGIQNGCCMLKLTADDLVALGQLYLDQGQVAGQEIVPADWVTASTRPSAANVDYGYLWYRGHIRGTPAFAASGFPSQLIVVVPDRRAVITVATVGTDQAALEFEDAIAMIDEVIAPTIG
ncbi:MAG TPA: serine hydrolase, partial [Microlunatus sp.]